MKFSYYSGSGNTFLIATCFSEDVNKLAYPPLIRKIALLPSPAVDGVLLLEINRQMENSNLRMHYFNRDGSRAKMCGNGLRAIARYAYDTHASFTPSMTIMTDCGPRTATVFSDGSVEVDMGIYPFHSGRAEEQVIQEVLVPISNSLFLERFGYSINTGVPHVVFFSCSIQNEPVFEVGKTVRESPLFKPDGSNVNFAEVISYQNRIIRVRTYERGVEDETGACGTGACAVVLALCHIVPYSRDEYERTFTIIFRSTEEASLRVTRTIKNSATYLQVFFRSGVSTTPSKNIEYTHELFPKNKIEPLA